jgi:hypothetical protein
MLQNLFARFFKKTSRSDKASPKRALSSEATIPDTPVSFGYKCNWLSEEYENDPDYLDNVEWPDESITMEVAGAWSIDPQDLENRNDISPTLGLLGRYY